MNDARASWAHDTVRLLRQLLPNMASVLKLQYFSGLSEAEICAVTGLSSDEVRAHSSAGLRQLGRLLEREPVRSTSTAPTPEPVPTSDHVA